MREYNRLLVTGGAGFIGSHFVDSMLQKGRLVVVLDALTYAGSMQNLAPNPNLIFRRGNIQDPVLVDQLLREYQIEAVLNFAAESHVDRSIEGAAEFIQTNIVGTFNLLNMARKYYCDLNPDRSDKFLFLQVSTDEVFGSLGPQGSFNEESRYMPNSPYSASKASADHLCRAWGHTYKLPVIVTHCSNNFGSRQYPEKLIPRMISQCLSGGKLPVYGNGQNVRDWIHVSDHCAGIALALTSGEPFESYCFGGQAEISNLDLVRKICGLLDGLRPLANGRRYEELIEFVKDRAGHDFRYAIDDSKAQDKLGFKRGGSFDDRLQETVAWYVENPNWFKDLGEAK